MASYDEVRKNLNGNNLRAPQLPPVWGCAGINAAAADAAPAPKSGPPRGASGPAKPVPPPRGLVPLSAEFFR